MQGLTKKWLERAKYDLETAKAMLKSGRYLYVAFMCQQSLEKILKGIILENGGEVLRTHSLVRLAEVAQIIRVQINHSSPMRNRFRDIKTVIPAKAGI